MAPQSREARISKGTWIDLALALAVLAWALSLARQWGRMETRLDDHERRIGLLEKP